MHKNLLHLLICLAGWVATGYGQVVDHHEFVGTIQLEDQSIITYKLLFDEYANGSISGTSITDFTGSHRTESDIKGVLNDRRDKISFRELSNITTKSDIASDDFCYIQMDRGDVSLSRKKALIKGTFTSKYTSGEDCIQGTIMLMSEAVFSKKLASVTKKVKRFAPRSKKQKTLEVLEDSKVSLDETLILKDDEVLSLSAYTDTITLQVWDDQYIDGDKITISVNDIPMISGHEVKQSVETFEIPLPTNTTTITISADNEGKYPPNSSNVSIVHQDTEIPVSVRLLEGKVATFSFVKQLATQE